MANSKVENFMKGYVSYLRALYLIHQNNHWQCKGPNFYSNHLLLQRIYESASEQTDMAAEKAIGLFGNEIMNLSAHTKLAYEIAAKYDSKNYQSKNPHIESSLEAEEDFIKFSQRFYDYLKNNQEMTLGLDDLIMSIANSREEAIYLLKQSTE